MGNGKTQGIPYRSLFSARSGFTLIEAFFVMLIITLFTSLTGAYIQRVRLETRDVKRLADLGQVRAALQLYAHTQNTFPQGNNIMIGTPPAQGLDNHGWVATPEEPIYLSRLSPDPLPSATSPCVKSVPQPCAYSYTSDSSADYSVRFYLEHGVPPLSAPGLYRLTPDGWRP